MTIRSTLLGTSALLGALLLGCGGREISLYRAAKQSEQPQVAAQPAESPRAAPRPNQSPLTWQLPNGWEQLPAGEMRLGDFRIRGADGAQVEVMITPLGGRAGGDLANVNRWRGQVGLGPFTEDQLATNYESVEVAHESARLYEMAGVGGDDTKMRILAVILPRGETSWFFKMIGSDELVQKEKSAFKQFLNTISFNDVAAAHARN